jgi:transcriptional regulator
VTPQSYVETKPADGKVFPTWNYFAVQCYGTATFYLGVGDPDLPRKQVHGLTDVNDRKMMRYCDEPWEVDDAPEKYIEMLMKAIVAIEIEVTRMEGKWKTSQAMSKEDRQGVILYHF